MSAFIDEARIRVKAGDGGNGAASFRREKYVPKGGPSGGDGGNGGSVILEVDEGLSTLLDFRYRTEYRAPSGESGGNKDMYGRGGDDLVLRVPPGTQVFDDEKGILLADLRGHGTRFVAARGGRGGRGNIHFATATDRAPRRAEPGTPGRERLLRLELKLLADVGLLGFPNVGKSSFIARISAARPKIADYEFTTLVPNLGMVRLSGDRSFVVADVPGLIEGAHEGAGLGIRFLRHLERTRVLVHLLEVSPAPGRTPLRDYDALRRELALYDPELARRPEVVVLNKLDVPEVRKKLPTLRRAFEKRGLALHGISAATGQGVKELLEEVWRLLAAETAAARAKEAGKAKDAAPLERRPADGAEAASSVDPGSTPPSSASDGPTAETGSRSQPRSPKTSATSKGPRSGSSLSKPAATPAKASGAPRKTPGAAKVTAKRKANGKGGGQSKGQGRNSNVASSRAIPASSRR